MVTETITDIRSANYTLDDDDSSVTIAKRGAIIVTAGSAVIETLTSSGNTFTVNGILWAGTIALLARGTGTTIVVGVDGVIGGAVGISAAGDDVDISVAGRVVSASEEAILIQGDSAEIEITGLVSGLVGLSASSADDMTVTIGANGVLEGQQRALFFGGTEPTSVSHIVNNGLLRGGTFALFGNVGIENVTNKGVMDGDVALGEGNDVFDNRRGTVKGTISGDEGDDTFIVKNSDTALSEDLDEGTDTVKSLASFSLGDHFENLILLGARNINAIGNSSENTVTGNTGRNTLSGLEGADSLFGGKGNDMLIGGSEGDTFVYKSACGKDTIADFELGVDALDLSGWKAATTLASLKNHAKEIDDDLSIRYGDDELVMRHLTKAELDQVDITL